MANTYSSGTVAVVGGSTSVTLTGGLSIPINMKPGDQIAIGNVVSNAIASLTDATHFELARPWAGASGAGLTYIVFHMPTGWGDRVDLAEQTAEIIRQLGRGVLTSANFATRAQLYADLNYPDGALGKVFGDTDVLNGVYKKTGGNAAGSWARIGPLPELDAVDAIAEQVTIVAENIGNVNATGNDIEAVKTAAENMDAILAVPVIADQFGDVAGAVTATQQQVALGLINKQATDVAVTKTAADVVRSASNANIASAAAGPLYDTPELGAAAVAEGAFYRVKGVNGGAVFARLYKKVSGIGVYQSLDTPSKAVIDALDARVKQDVFGARFVVQDPKGRALLDIDEVAIRHAEATRLRMAALSPVFGSEQQLRPWYYPDSIFDIDWENARYSYGGQQHASEGKLAAACGYSIAGTEALIPVRAGAFNFGAHATFPAIGANGTLRICSVSTDEANGVFVDLVTAAGARTLQMHVISGGANQSLVSIPVGNQQGTREFAVSVSPGDYRLCYLGRTIAADTSGSMPLFSLAKANLSLIKHMTVWRGPTTNALLRSRSQRTSRLPQRGLLQASIADGAWTGAQKNALSFKGSTYVAVNAHDGTQAIHRIDEATGLVLESLTVSTAYRDGGPEDHNQPSILITQQGALLVIYTGHANDGIIRWRRSPTGLLQDLGEENSFEIAGQITTYPEPIIHVSTGHIYLLYRSLDTTWSLAKSTDDGRNFTFICPLFTFADQLYTKAGWADPDTLRFAVYRNPTGTTTRDLKLAQANVISGDVVTDAGVVGNLYAPTTLPRNFTSLPLLHSGGAGFAVSCQFQRDDGNIAVMNVVANDETGADHYWLKFVGGDPFNQANWLKVFVVSAGTYPHFGSAGRWYGRMALSNEPGLSFPRLFVCTNDETYGYLSQWDAEDANGAVWKKTQTLAVAPKAGNRALHRPVSPVNASPRLPVFFMDGFYGDYFNLFSQVYWLFNGDV